MEASTAATVYPPDCWFFDVRSRLLVWAPVHYQPFPWRRPLPLWQGLIVEVMLQRTRAAQVVPVFLEFRERYPTAQAFSRAGKDELGELMAPLGLRWRVPLLSSLAREIGARRGRVPRDVHALLELPGVGPYAAAATVSLHGGRRAVLLDANTTRIACRLLGVDFGPETRRARWVAEFFERLVPENQHQAFNYGLLDLGMTVCLARRPQCGECPLGDRCASVQA